MRSGSRVYLIGASVAIAALAACSSSTSPSSQPRTPAQLAADFDTMFYADSVLGTSQGTNAAALTALYFEAAAALGGTEATFTATTSSGTATLHGVAFAALVSGDTTFIVGLYPNRDLQQAIAIVAQTGSPDVLVATANGFTTIADDGTFNSFSGQILSTGSTCSLESGLLADPVIESAVSNSGFTCLSGVMNISLSVAFPPTDSLGALSSVSISNATFHGAVVSPNGGQHVVTIPSKGAAQFLKLESLLHH